MKMTLIILATTLTTLSAQARVTTELNKEAYRAKILTSATVKSVSCGELAHRGHEEYYAGETVIKTAAGVEAKMEILVSRYANEPEKEAAAICDQLSTALGNKSAVDIVYTEGYNGTSLRLEVKAATKINGLRDTSSY